jgi:hypothetical protein
VKLIAQFTEFLRSTVNLNQSRIDDLDGSVEALTNFVRQCEWGPTILGFEEQGSWAHETIIKPVDGGEFDADLLVRVSPVDGWSASDYVSRLGEAFAGSGVYGEKSKTWDYCVTITYAGDRKVDIAPLVVGRRYDGSLEVCNRRGGFERSEPTAYTAWLKEKNTYSGSNSFRKVTRLIKYLRDIKCTFTCSSVLLTTLLGNQINWNDQGSDAFSDVPTTLRTVMGRLDDWLQGRPWKPQVPNPKLQTEDFAAGWTDAQYENFRNVIHRYRGWIDEAYLADDRSDSIQAWRRVFGNDFAKGEAIVARNAVEEDHASKLRSVFMASAAHLDGLVDIVRRAGVSILPAVFYRPPHMQSPPWPPAERISTNVQITAQWHPHRDALAERTIQSGGLLPRHGGLWFEARVNNGAAVPEGFFVQWRITNTGAAAVAIGAGRGGFYPPMTATRRWEELKYRGVHIAEAFIIRRADNRLVGQSAPFNVVIE